MLFNSWTFILAFLPIVVAGCVLMTRYFRGRGLIIWLLFASLAFYVAWRPELVWILVLSTAFNFVVGRAICGRFVRKEPVQGLLSFGVSVNLAILAFFKYSTFLVENVNALIGWRLAVPDITLPVGISFFTFTQIAFLVDASRGMAEEYRSGRYGLFVTYFPHLVAGPIIHHRLVIPQFESSRFCKWFASDLLAGSSLFAIGLGKKVIVADSLAPFADAVFGAAAEGSILTLWEAWGGLLCYSMQLYFDFSGYSDMAVGLSLLFGVRLPLNFDSPYKAGSIIDFWQRWHISLSRFLRDYLYIPLGGNRRGAVRRFVNIAITMLLGGLWHGAAWTFVIWGGLHGCFLIMNHAYRTLRERLPGAMPRIAAPVGWMLTFLCVTVSWSFFRSETPETALGLLRSAVGLEGIDLPQTIAREAEELLGGITSLEIRFNGMFANGLVEETAIWIGVTFVATILAFLAPNSTQIVRYLAQLDNQLEAASTASDSRSCDVIRVTGAVAVGILLALGIAGIQRVSPFIYYQF